MPKSETRSPVQAERERCATFARRLVEHHERQIAAATACGERADRDEAGRLTAGAILEAILRGEPA